METEPARKDWFSGLDVLARSLAMLLFVLFAALLWHAVSIGSDNNSFQRVNFQITTLEASLGSLEAARRDAVLRAIRVESGLSLKDENPTTMAEARQGVSNAARDYEVGALRYFAAVCDAGKHLAEIGRLPRFFMPSTAHLKECPERSFDLPPGQPAKGDDPTTRIQEVRVVLEQYGVLANSYMLPILFGMLGALTFALRDLVAFPEHMGDLSMVLGYILRLFLGAIFGLIIGYVNIAGMTVSGLSASPLLLSLVAGFATDAVISLLDRIALAFSYDGGQIRGQTVPVPTARAAIPTDSSPR